MTLWTRFRIASGIVGTGAMIIVGGTTYLASGNLIATHVSLLVAAVLLATAGTSYARSVWAIWMLGLEQTVSEPTKRYPKTTRGESLAPKIQALVEKAAEATTPVTILVVGVEHLPEENGDCPWTMALDLAAEHGARIVHYLPETITEEEEKPVIELAQRYPDRFEVRKFVQVPNNPLETYWPVLAWSGRPAAPDDAILWLEDVRDRNGRTTSVEYRNTLNLSKHPEMLAELVKSIRQYEKSKKEESE